MERRILVLSAHADDHLTTAGTIFKLRETRNAVPFEVILTDSSRGQDFRSQNHASRSEVAEMRRKELSEASLFLGMRETFHFNEPDYGLIYKPELVFGVAKVIRSVSPQLVIMTHNYDSHPDHKATAHIGIEAIRLASMGIEIDRLGTPHRVPEIAQAEMMQPDRVNKIIDVTAQLPKLEELFSIYGSQVDKRLRSYLMGLLAVRAYTFEDPRVHAAEAFIIPNEFPSIVTDNNLLA